MYFLIISTGYTHCRLETGFCVYKKSCIEPALQTSIDIYSAAKPLFVRSILLPRKHPIPGTCTGQLLSCIRSNFFHWIWEVWQSRLKSNWSTTWEGTWSWSFQVRMQEQCVSNNFHHNPPPLSQTVTVLWLLLGQVKWPVIDWSTSLLPGSTSLHWLRLCLHFIRYWVLSS